MPDANPESSPYAPPQAALLSATGGPLPERPALVTRAVYCLWAIYTIGVFSTLWKLATPSAQMVTLSASSPSYPWLMPLIMYTVIFGLTAWLYRAIGKGRNWARILYIIFTGFSVVSVAFVLVTFNAGGLSGFEALVSAINMCIAFYVCYLLLTRPAREWYREMKERA